MMLLVLELGESTSIKEKRRVVSSIKERLRSKYRVSCAEVDLQDSLRFAQLGAAIVSNSREFGEKVLANAAEFVENWFDVRLHDVQIHSESYD